MITPESIELLNLYHRSRQLQSVTGASMYGPNLLDWPARLLDAFSVVADEERRVSRLMRQATASRQAKIERDGA